ncbi:MAG: hypothetical protein ACOYLP_07345 [Flavobacterium sp.]|uniref:hypothetical protein n=1 Tax=Flavobacterium sp. TaxID=239 RepID=UPI003BED2668
MIIYNDSDLQKIVFSAIIIKVSSVVKKFGSIAEFSIKHNFSGVTNGNLLITAEMNSPPYRLEEFVEKVLIPNGFINELDYVFIEEMLTKGVKGEVSELINEPHPHCKNINWLQSIIVQDGNFVWFSEPSLNDFERDSNFRLYKNLLYHEEEKIKLNPRIIKIDETYVHYTVSDNKMRYKIHRDALWYNELKYGKSIFSK